MEQIRSALAAAQHAEMVAFGRHQVEQQIALVENGRLDPVALGRGIAEQIALACRVSPLHGSHRLGIARALDSDLPGVGALLAAGRISEPIAEIMVSQTSHLDPELRRLVDRQLTEGGLDELSLRRAESLISRCAYDADRAGYLTRGRTARKDRRVGLRPAPDTMSVLSGFLPVEQGVACLAALRAHDHHPRRRAVPGPVLRRPDPTPRPHRPPPNRRPHQFRQRAWDLRPRELRPRDARLARRAHRRRARGTTTHRTHHHPHRPHLHQ